MFNSYNLANSILSVTVAVGSKIVAQIIMQLVRWSTIFYPMRTQNIDMQVWLIKAEVMVHDDGILNLITG